MFFWTLLSSVITETEIESVGQGHEKGDAVEVESEGEVEVGTKREAEVGKGRGVGVEIKRGVVAETGDVIGIL